MLAELNATQKSTCDRLFERYNTYNRRATVRDAVARVRIFRSFRRVLGPWLPSDRSARILDVACGEGALLCFLKTLGYRNLSGFDISSENVSICHELGLTHVRQLDALCLDPVLLIERYNLIFATDIVEHLPKQAVAGFLDQIRQLLLPGGSVVIQTPNMGSLQGLYLRYCDLSHEFGLTEKSAFALLMTAGFEPDRIELRPAWNATTFLGTLREVYMGLLHFVVFAAEGGGRPRIPTKDLLIRACVP